MATLTRCLLLVLLVCTSTSLEAQEVFDLVVPGTNVRSTAEIDGRALHITDGQGQTFTYVRAPEYDAADGTLVGYTNARLAKIIRWPSQGVGRMQIGSISGGRASFRESKMNVRRVATTTSRRPVLDVPDVVSPPPTSRDVRSRAGQANGIRQSSYVAALQGSHGQMWAAHIGHRGRISFAHEQEGRWRSDQTTIGSDSLIPGAPLALFDDQSSDLPIAYTTDRDGRLVRFSDGRGVTSIVFDNATPNAHLASGSRDGRPLLWLVDRQGRMPEFHLARSSRPDYVEGEAGGLLPGSSVGVTSGEELFVIDASGGLRRYVRGARWHRADPLDQQGNLIPRGFAPGGILSVIQATPPGGHAPKPHVVTFDANGIPRVVYETATSGRWLVARVGTTRHRPGAPLTATFNESRLRLSWVSADGTWQEFSSADAAGVWKSRTIAQGFSPHAPVLFHRRGPRGFAVDRRGALVVAGLGRAGVWSCAVCLPGFAYAPTLISRQMIAGPPLPPANVAFLNTHRRELWVAISDLRAPSGEIRLKIRPGESARVALDRDAGASFVERYEVFDLAGGSRIEQRVYEIPARPLYDVSVYELWLQSVAIDSTERGGGKIEDANWSPRSIGAFPLSAGPELQDGDVVDVYPVARSYANPGGVRRINPDEWSRKN